MEKNIKILVISNGFGEDQIATTLIIALKSLHPNILITAIPLVGEGLEYQKAHIQPSIKNKLLPSGGFIRSLKDLIIDIKAGLLKHVFSQNKAIRLAAKRTHFTLCIGDIYCLTKAPSKKPTYFFPTAKSDTFMPHSFLEKKVIKNKATLTFTRDKITCKSLQLHHINALCFGNIMMDNLTQFTPLEQVTPTDFVLGILPGSRNEAYKNNEHIDKIIHHLTIKNLKVFVSKAPNIDTQKLQKTMTYPHSFITQNFKGLINRANLIIGLSGTANEQALHQQKVVICFEGFGPQSTLQRFKEQQQLMGPHLIIIKDRHPKKVATIIEKLSKPLQTSDTPPTQNASLTIAKYLLKNLPI